VNATKVNAGLAESNGRLLLGIWRDSLHATCGLTACTPGSAPGPTLGNEYGKTLPFLSTIKTVIRLCTGISQNHNPCARARSESLPGAQKLQLRHWSGQVGRCQPGNISVFSAFSAIEPRCCRYRGESPITASALLASSFKHCGPPCIHTAGGPRLSLSWAGRRCVSRHS